MVMTKQEKAKDARLRREFHITLAEYYKVLDYQQGVCYICKHKYNKKGKPLQLSVDHDHTTGEVRGLLCWPCNKAIAILQDDIERMHNAYLYFKNIPFEVVLGEKRYTAPGKIGAKKRIKQLAAFNAARGVGAKKEKGQIRRKSRKV